MSKPLQLYLLSGLAVICICVSLVFGEFISNTNAYQYLRNDVNIPATFLRMSIMTMTVFPVAFFVGRIVTHCSPTSGRTALIGVALSIAIIIAIARSFHLRPQQLYGLYCFIEQGYICNSWVMAGSLSASSSS